MYLQLLAMGQLLPFHYSKLTFFNNSALRSLTTVDKVTQRKDRATRGQGSLLKVKKHHSNSLASGASALAW